MKRIQINRGELHNMLWKRYGRVAKQLGIHTTTLSKKVRGEKPFVVDELEMIAEICQVPLEQFIRIGNGQ